MKTILGFLLLMNSMLVLAQFPVPTNFDFSYDYIMIEESGYCAGSSILGPTYCSHFSWDTPDTNSTSTNLEYYNLYYHNYDENDTTILASVSETSIYMEIGIIGEVWVTAVYSNPYGESEPSNNLLNEALPDLVNDKIVSKDLKIFYNSEQQDIYLNSSTIISQIKVYNIQGELVKTQRSGCNKINVQHLSKGTYIIEVQLANQKIIQEKIIK